MPAPGGRIQVQCYVFEKRKCVCIRFQHRPQHATCQNSDTKKMQSTLDMFRYDLIHCDMSSKLLKLYAMICFFGGGGWAGSVRRCNTGGGGRL